MAGYGAQIVAKAWDGDGVPVEDSNVAGIGSEEDMAARKNAAMTEPAWKGAGTEAGLWVWRIENFKVVPWPRTEYGKFYKGDSYIVLHTSAKEGTDALIHQIHFWLGEGTSIDEQGTAAYKTVELDDYFDGAPTQHREVMGNESDQFTNLFPKGMKYLDGGIDSGFFHATKDTYEAKLLRFYRRPKNHAMLVWEVPCELASLNQSDSFILDAGEVIYVWQGEKASPHEKIAAALMGENMEAERCGKGSCSMTCDDAFWAKLGGQGDIKESDEGGKDSFRRRAETENQAVLFRLSDESGTLNCAEVARGDLTKDMLKSDDVMMLDEGHAVCLWVGKGASAVEKKNALRIAMQFLKTNGKPMNTPIHIFKEGQPIKNENWRHAFHN